MIDKNKVYKTRNGREVRIYATDGAHEKVHGAMLTEDGWEHRTWNSYGRIMLCEAHEFDLIEVRPRIKRTVWLHVFEHTVVAAEEPPFADITNRLACVKVEIDCEEGERLNTSAKRV